MDPAPVRKITRRKGACQSCRQRKIRCDGLFTCSQCSKSGITCSYEATRSIQHDQSASFSRHASRNNPNRHEHRATRQKHDSPLDNVSPILTPTGTRTPLQDCEANMLARMSLNRGYSSDSVSNLLQQASAKADTSLPVIGSDATLDGEFLLDHSREVGTDQAWSSSWAEQLCGNPSSTALLLSLARHVRDQSLAKDLTTLSHRLFSKAQDVPKGIDMHNSTLATDTMSLYSQQETSVYVEAFFTGCYGYPTFVSRQYVEDILADLIYSPSKLSPCASALIHGVLALGCRTHARNSPDVPPAQIARSFQYFKRALSLRNESIGGQSTLVKLQALVTMVIYLKGGRDITQARSLLSHAVHHVQELTLALPRLPSTSEDQDQRQGLQRIYWLLYSIEKPLMLRFGGYSMIDDELVSFQPPSKEQPADASADTQQLGWQLVNYRYARLCSAIVKTLYSPASVRMAPSDTAVAVSRLSRMLEAWRLSVPQLYRPQQGPRTPAPATRPWGSCIQTDMLLKYAEAVFAIHRWSAIYDTATITADLTLSYVQSRDACIEISKSLLGLTPHFNANDPEMDWPRIFLPVVSAASMFISLTKGELARDVFPYFSMACGYYARFVTSGSHAADFFDAVNELNLAAHRICSNVSLEEIKSQAQPRSEPPITPQLDLDSDPLPLMSSTLPSAIATPESIDFQMQDGMFLDMSGISDLQFLEFPEDGSDSLFGCQEFAEFPFDKSLAMDLL